MSLLLLELPLMSAASKQANNSACCESPSNTVNDGYCRQQRDRLSAGNICQLLFIIAGTLSCTHHWRDARLLLAC